MVETENKAISAAAIMMKALANESRLRILYALYKRPRTWNELLFELKINPKSLRDHLGSLRKSRLVKKRDPVGFELTQSGKAVIELSLEEVISIAEKAMEISRTEKSK
jgi:predicted transcriptional regulator